MRYRIGTDPEQGASAPDVALFVGAAALGLAMGVGFVIAGLRGRQIWLAVWGAGLVAASTAYLIAAALGHG